MEIPQKDRFLGCMYGLAIGDALGYPVEFMSNTQIKSILGNNGVAGFDSLKHPGISGKMRHPIGSYSDDTQMTLATANGIINSKTDKLDDVMDNIAKEYMKWYSDPQNNRAPGNTCMSGVRNLIAGKHWSTSGVEGKGCGAAMRTAPIGLYCAQVPRKIYQLASNASSCTHRDQTPTSAGIATATLVNLALRNSTPEYMAMRAENLWGNCNEEFNGKIRQMNEYLKSQEDPSVALKKIGEGWKGDEAVAMALYCFLKNPTDYAKTVLMGANIDGDSDSVASIAGAISGAYNGVEAIPKKWINQIENKELLRKTAEGLLERSLKLSED